MTSLFFELLPADLQIDILHVWLNAQDSGFSLLKVLSALDVACSPSEQPSLLFLMGQLPAFGEYTAPSNRAIRHIEKYLLWLASRKVAVRSLLLSGRDVRMDELDDLLTFPQVDTLHLTGDDYGTEEWACMIRCAPNLTAIHQSICVVITLPANLKVLVTTRRDHFVSPFLCPCPSLQVLRMEHSILSANLADHLVKRCPHLRLLEMSMWHSDINHLTKVLQTCLNLEELVLHDLRSSDIPAVAAFSNIKRLTSLRTPFDNSSKAFLHALECCPNLDFFKLNGFEFSRSNAVLKLPADSGYIPFDYVSKVLSNFSSLVTFSCPIVLDCDTVIEVAARLDTLRSLSVGYDSEVLFKTLTHRCGGFLRHLELDCWFKRVSFAFVASLCPRLISLVLRLRHNWNDICGPVPILEELKELTVNAVINQRAILQSIASHRMRLRLLKLLDGFSELDAEWFRQQARDLQLLPVPVILLTDE